VRTSTTTGTKHAKHADIFAHPIAQIIKHPLLNGLKQLFGVYLLPALATMEAAQSVLRSMPIAQLLIQ
jgi:hypothetical protein